MIQEVPLNAGNGSNEQAIHDVSVVNSQNVTFNQTQIIQISVEEIKTRTLITTSPYKGLKTFELEDKERFFGRDQCLTGLVNELEHTNLILLLGASGSGKSSVIRAGLIPWLAQQWGSHFVSLVFTPDRDPFDSLYATLLGKYKQSDAQLARLVKPETLTQVMRSLKHQDDYWFILIDQFEELFTTTESDKRNVFIQGLVNLVNTLSKKSDHSVKLVATMRTDFLDRLSPYPALIKLTDKHRPMIADLQADELRLAIEQPAAHHGVVFESGLVKEIIDDVQGQAGYLPLLQYTLNLLWEMEVQTESIEDRTLNLSNYHKLGGVRGALQQHVDRIYSALSDAEQVATRRICLKLVDIGADTKSGTDWKPVRRRANRSEFSEPLEQTVLTQLVNQNLLVSNRVKESQDSTIEIAHEVLLTSWKTLNIWIAENRQAIALRNRLNDDVIQWQKTTSSEDLWSGSRLEQALELRQNQTFNQVLGGFSPTANQFLEQSRDKRDQLEKEKLRRTQLTVITAISVAVLLGGFWWRSERLRQETVLRENIATARNLLTTDPTQAAVRSIYVAGQSAAHYTNLLSSTESVLLDGIQRAREENVFNEHEGQVLSVAMSPDGQTIASAGADGKVILIDLLDFSKEVIENFPDSSATSVAFSHKGQFLASADSNGNVKIRRLEDHSLVCDSPSEEDNIYYQSIYGLDLKTIVEFNPKNETFLVNAGPNNQIHQLQLRNGNCKKQNILTLEDKNVDQNHDYEVYPPLARSIAFSPDGQQLAIGYDSGLILHDLLNETTQVLWEGRSAEPVESISFKNRIFFSICIGEWAEGNSITIKTLDKSHSDFRTPEGFTVHEDCSRAVLVDSETDRIISGGNDRGDRSNLVTFISWKERDLFSFIGHKGRVNALAMSSDKKHLVSAGSDGTVRLWSVENFPNDVASLFRNQFNEQLEVWDLVGRQLNLNKQDEAIEIQGKSESLIETDGKSTPFVSQQRYPKKFFGYDGQTVITVETISASSSETPGTPATLQQLILINQRETNSQLGKIELSGEVWFAAANHKQNKLIVIKPDKIEIFNFQGTQLDSFPNDKEANVAAISPDGRMFAIAKEHFSPGFRATALQLFDMKGKAIANFENEGIVSVLGFSSDSRHVITEKFGEIHLFPANWQASLEILCDRLRHHPVLTNPQDEIARGARETCQSYAPSWQAK